MVLEPDPSSSEELTPRLYQEQLGERSMKKNTIIHLPTGSGKTFIAIMLIKRMKKDIVLPWGEGGKRSVFLVNTVPLVEQQKAFINRLAPVKCGGYSSENKVDLWDKAKWDVELSKHNVLVMTSQILADMLAHRFIKLENLNLLIFDECHHAVDDHPMRQIMKCFELCPRERQPKVLGLTATLLNSNVPINGVIKTIEMLETTFHATIATVGDMGEVVDYSTNPRELIINYSAPILPDSATRAIMILNNLIICVNGVKLPSTRTDVDLKLEPGQYNFTKDPKLVNKKVKNMIVDMQSQISALGLFGGSLGVLAYIIALERLRRRADNKEENLFYKHVITHSTMARTLLEQAMSDKTGYEKIITYSSEHILQMLAILKEYDDRKFDSAEEGTVNVYRKPLCAIIFCQRRFTSKILYNLLKEVREASPREYAFLKHDYIVGFNINPYNNTREDLFEKKYSQSALLKFSNGDINCLISTSVIEEGVDIPRCSLVLRYDPPQEYRSYIQSKGRARCKTSSYVLLVNRKEDAKFREKYRMFNDCERHIQQLLVGTSQDREDPTKSRIEEELYRDEDIPPFVLKSGARITDTSAIRLVNQYCAILPRDQFTVITPNWIHETYNGEYRQIQVTIVMPINCPVKEPIKGLRMASLKAAKRSAALETCKKLYYAGELEAHTGLPKRYGKVDFDQPCVKSIFENWEDEPKKDGLAGPGTNKRIRKHDKVYPKCFMGVGHWQFGTQTFYLHLITLKTTFDQPLDSRERALYELLNMREGFGVLTSQALPRLCEFPMFMAVGEVRTTLDVNYGTVVLDRGQFDSVKEFHLLIFEQVLDVAKKFVTFDGTTNSAYVVPVSPHASGVYEVAWGVIGAHREIAPVAVPVDDVRINLRVTPAYKYSVVSPWYRGVILPNRYIVSKVLDSMSPRSKFEKENCGTYEEYYANKYNLCILGRKDQPLLEVKHINSRRNCLLPRASTLNTFTGKQLRQASSAQGDDKPSDFKENLIPEFCIKYDFPGVLWCKATLLPSILHRISMLLVANDLRIEICEATKLGSPTIAQSQQWKPITLDEHAAAISLLAACSEPGGANSVDRINFPLDDSPARPLHIATMKDSLYRLQMKRLECEYPWDENKEPIDIERNLTSVTLMDIECYDEFMMTPVLEPPAPTPARAPSTSAAICPPPLKYHDQIALLSPKDPTRGLELKDLLTALTVVKANDTFNLERTETLGDSFLKFAATLYLFHKFPKLNEGQLTNIKGRLIGNRNLFYAGRRVSLGGRMKAEQFSPRDDFLLPGFATPPFLVDIINSKSIRPTFLIGVELSRAERLTGQLTKKSCDGARERCAGAGGLVETEPEGGVQAAMQCYVHKQALPDKVVADCVESLIGVYLVSCGIKGAVRILEWLQVLPAEDNFESYLTRKVPTVVTEDKKLVSQIEFLLNDSRQEIEEIIGYTFKDPSFLLEALSHPSFIRNRLTNSYERLEFLGDALLDFLITSHIFETYPTLKPGQLTDLRSALVNNVTFAGYVVKLGLHRYILSLLNPNLERAIMQFVQHQEQRAHAISEEVLYLIDEADCHMAEYVEVPKVLSDIFESLAGAIFLDSGGDMRAVWRVYYAIMCRELDAFARDVPIQPVRLLRERIHACPIFGEPVKVSPDQPTVMAPVTITVNGRVLTVHGFGGNKHQARRAAAKIALKNLQLGVPTSVDL